MTGFHIVGQDLIGDQVKAAFHAGIAAKIGEHTPEPRGAVKLIGGLPLGPVLGIQIQHHERAGAIVLGQPGLITPGALNPYGIRVQRKEMLHHIRNHPLGKGGVLHNKALLGHHILERILRGAAILVKAQNLLERGVVDIGDLIIDLPCLCGGLLGAAGRHLGTEEDALGQSHPAGCGIGGNAIHD